ncbi:hypothetical protein [Neorhizobium tomejilense]|uniref:hyaluronate lyase N-terminal domain-containing protein n=1 Tax=Neorhizobium tomejilense TaxID=2093828 RepID=UPI000CFA00D6|nr:hypothetical protein [Neorhizobium tomejilense]
MATQIRHRRGSTAEHAAFTGALAEITVDTDKKTAVVHDGVTPGGVPLAREDGKNDGAFGYQQDVKTNDYAIVVGDIGKMLVANKATAINFTLGTAAALTSKFVAGFKNIGVGTLSITPNGAELIDGVNAVISVPAGASLILKGDGTSFRTFVSNGDVTGAAIHNAATKAALADADEMAVIDTAAANVLKKFTLANLISSIFKTARTILNAQFDAASFKLFNAAGTPRALTFVTTALTADRSVTMPDANVDLAGIPVVSKSTPQNLTFSTLITWAHGLGAKPSRVTVKLVNVTTNAGFAVDDDIYLGTYWTTSGTPSGVVIGADANVVFANVPGGYSVFAKSTFGNTGLTAASWKIVFEAQK